MLYLQIPVVILAEKVKEIATTVKLHLPRSERKAANYFWCSQFRIIKNQYYAKYQIQFQSKVFYHVFINSLSCLSVRANFVIDFKLTSRWARLEIWIIAQKWMAMNENVKKEGKKTKMGRDKYENVSTKHSFTCICAGSYVANSNVMYV